MINTLVILNAVALLITCIVCVTFFANAWRIGNFDASTEPKDYTRFLISVIIPAHNEEMDLRQTLHSVLSQEGVRLEVIVINDHSDDRTGAIAEAVAAEDGRVTVIHDPPLKPGWLGKCNALEHGRHLASGDYIILSDADIDHHPRCFSSAMEHFERHDLDLFSLFPLIICESLWENIFLPLGVIAAGMLFWKRPGQSGDANRASAAGAFILTKSDVLARVGAFESIKGEMLDDVALARRVQAAGGRIDLHLAPHLVQVRLFKDNAHAFWGVTKNILAGVDIVWMAIPAILLPFVVFWCPLVALVVGGASGHATLASLGIAAIIVQLLMYVGVRRWCRYYWYKVIFYPLVAIQCACCFCAALYYQVSDQAVHWRGRAISIRDTNSF